MTKRELFTPKGERLSRVPLLLEEGAFQELTFIRSCVKVWEGEAKEERNRSAFIRSARKDAVRRNARGQGRETVTWTLRAMFPCSTSIKGQLKLTRMSEDLDRNTNSHRYRLTRLPTLMRYFKDRSKKTPSSFRTVYFPYIS